VIIFIATIIVMLCAIAPFLGTDTTDITAYDERIRPRCLLLCAERS
jgi:hypothetical protein